MKPTSSNFLLASLSPQDLQRLAPDLQPVVLVTGQILYQPGEYIHTAYFPEEALITLGIAMANRSRIEQGIVGRLGMIGLPTILGGRQFTTNSVVVQLEGMAMAMKAEVLQLEFSRCEALQRLLLLYTEFRLAQVSQLSACRSWHSVDQRLARWLLTVEHELLSKQLPLTQQLIAEMMGVRRAGVTEAAGRLQAAGLIHYSRGKIQILDSSGLESAACECHSRLNQEWQRLMDSEQT